jgi:hypothetical protein
LRRLVIASWDDVPHLTEEMKVAQLSTMDPHLRDARRRGIPFLGSGAVYPVPTEVIEIKPFPIPDHWVRIFGLDVGWHRTAAIWGAHDRDSDIVYLYDEHYVGEENPRSHAESIKGSGVKSNLRAPWIPGVIDPASKGRSQKDGEKLLETYRNLGLDLETAVNAVEAGIREVWLRLSSGRLKVFSTLQFWFKEYLLYRRDKNGKIIESKARPDHLMDATRYLIVSGLDKMKQPPYDMTRRELPDWGDPELVGSQGWMSA